MIDIIHPQSTIPKTFIFPYLCLLGHIVAQLDVLDLQIESEGVVVVAVEDAGPGGLPQEAVAGGGADGVPERGQVQAVALGFQEKLSHVEVKMFHVS